MPIGSPVAIAIESSEEEGGGSVNATPVGDEHGVRASSALRGASPRGSSARHPSARQPSSLGSHKTVSAMPPSSSSMTKRSGMAGVYCSLVEYEPCVCEGCMPFLSRFV